MNLSREQSYKIYKSVDMAVVAVYLMLLVVLGGREPKVEPRPHAIPVVKYGKNASGKSSSATIVSAEAR